MKKIAVTLGVLVIAAVAAKHRKCKTRSAAELEWKKPSRRYVCVSQVHSNNGLYTFYQL